MNIRWMSSMSSVTSCSGWATFSPRFRAARTLTVLVLQLHWMLTVSSEMDVAAFVSDFISSSRLTAN